MINAVSESQQIQPVQDIVAGYQGGDEMPLGPYLGLVGAYNVALAAFLLASKDERLPERMDFKDILLLGVATHKISRLITQDWVTSPLRAPFTQYQGSTGAGEVKDKSRGTGVQKAIGDLLTCPWCTGAWVAAVMGYSLAFSPRLTRWIGGIFAMETISDFLHIAYERAKKELK